MRPEYIIDFNSARNYLRQFVPVKFEAYTLDRITKLMDFLGNPQDSMKVIHVAGTSGKTSTCYYIAALLNKAGCKVGHTVSPHVEEVNERAQINLSPLHEKEYCSELREFTLIAEKSSINPTYFELLVAFAFWLFKKQGVKYAVVEVGLGGLLDGTNVINRRDKVCVITDIGFDHTDILGKTLTEIAGQKAGIIQPDNHVFIHEQDENVTGVIQNVCREKNAALIKLPSVNTSNESLPPFQQRNFDLADKVVEFVLSRDGNKSLTPALKREASNIMIPARMEVVDYQGKTVIIDGSHNEQKISALVEGVKQRFPDRKITFLVSFGENKASIALSSLEILRTLGDSIILTSFTMIQDGMRQAISPEDLAEMSKLAGFNKIESEQEPQKALELGLRKTDDVLLITGSYFLLNHLRPALVRNR